MYLCIIIMLWFAYFLLCFEDHAIRRRSKLENNSQLYIPQFVCVTRIGILTGLVNLTMSNIGIITF